MKGVSLLMTLATLIAMTSLSIMALAAWHVLLTRDLNKAQFAINQIETRQARLRALVNECAEYGKRNADIHPLLQSVGVRMSALPSPVPASPSPTNP